MKLVVLCTLVSVISFAHAAQIITNPEVIKELETKFQENEFWQQRRWPRRDIQLDRYKLGSSKSAYFYENGKQKRIYEERFSHTGHKACYEISFGADINSFQVINCEHNKVFDLATHPDYKQVSLRSLRQNSADGDYEQNSFEQTIELNAFGHTYDMFLMDVDSFGGDEAYILREYPKKKMQVTFSESEIVKLGEKEFSIKYSVSIASSGLSILPPKTQSFERIISFDPARGDLLFSNGNEILLYKNYGSLRWRPSTPSLSMAAFEAIQENRGFYDNFVDRKKYCFRDNLLSRNKQYSCHELIFNKQNLVNYSRDPLHFVKI